MGEIVWGWGAVRHGFCRFWVTDSDAAKSRGIAPSMAIMADAYLALPQRLPSQEAAGIDMSTHLRMPRPITPAADGASWEQVAGRRCRVGKQGYSSVRDSRVPLAFDQSLGSRSGQFGTGLRLTRHLPLRHISLGTHRPLPRIRPLSAGVPFFFLSRGKRDWILTLTARSVQIGLPEPHRPVRGTRLPAAQKAGENKQSGLDAFQALREQQSDVNKKIRKTYHCSC